MPVVPVVINGTRGMLPSDQWLPVPGKVKVIVKPTVISRALDDPIPGMIKTCRQSILEDLEEPDLV